MDNQGSENKDHRRKRKSLTKLLRKSKWYIYLLMVTIMIVATGAFWFNAAIFHRDNLMALLYANGVIISLVLRFTGHFPENRKPIVIILTLTLMYLVATYYNEIISFFMNLP